MKPRLMKPRALLRLIRPVNCLMMGFAVVVGAALAVGVDIVSYCKALTLGFATSFALTAGAMAVNDYHDREIDAINEPGRPIPSGDVKPGEALALSSAMSALGLIAAWMTNLPCLAVAGFTWVVMMLYSTRGKRTGLPGNLLVSTCIAVPFVYGGLAVENSLSMSSLMFSLLAFLSNTGREVTKGIVDLDGDRNEGVRTVAVSKGVRAAAVVSAISYLSAATISFIPLSLSLVSAWYAPLVAVTDAGLIHSSFSLLRDPSVENSRRVKNRVLIWMMFGLLGLLLGSLSIA